MHYKDGTEAKLGDVARGKGYNLPYVCQGVVVGLTPGASSCSIHLMVPRPYCPAGTKTAVQTILTEEHGTCEDFELVSRTG